MQTLVQTYFIIIFWSVFNSLEFETDNILDACHRLTVSSCCDQSFNSIRQDCHCPSGYRAGRHRRRAVCVKKAIYDSKQFCQMMPCLKNETCKADSNGWSCIEPKTTGTLFETRVDIISIN